MALLQREAGTDSPACGIPEEPAGNSDLYQGAAFSRADSVNKETRLQPPLLLRPHSG
jgi:hypothetical protein